MNNVSPVTFQSQLKFYYAELCDKFFSFCARELNIFGGFLIFYNIDIMSIELATSSMLATEQHLRQIFQ